jgi:hypothetical protein
MGKIFYFKDVEEIIFSHPIIQKTLPKYKSFFDSYKFSKINPVLKNLAIRSVFGFINSINEEEIKIISDILGYEISINKVNVDNIKNISCNINEIEFNLEDAYNYSEICIYRKQDEVKILCWR